MRLVIAILAASVALTPNISNAQLRPSAHSTIRTTDTTASSLLVGCAFNVSTGCTGGINAGQGVFSAGLAIDGGTISTHGIVMPTGVPGTTTMALYNNAGTLTWNGAPLAVGSSVSGTQYRIPFFSSATSVGDSIMLQNAAATLITLTGTLNTTTAYQLNGTDVNTTGTFTNVAYKGQNNTFTVSQTFNAGIGISGGAPSTHGIMIPSAVPGVTTTNLYNNANTLTWLNPASFTTVDTGQGANELYDMDQNMLTTSSPTLAAVLITGAGVTALEVDGGITVGSGNVALVGIDGKINGPLSTTIIDDLSGANLTTLNASNVSSGTLADARLEAILNVVTEVVSPLFTGGLTGNVTGNVSGTSGSTTGNAVTVTNATFTTAFTNNGGAGTLAWPAAGATLTVPTGGGTLGSAAFTASTAYDVAGAAAAVTPTTLGLVIGTNVQAYDADLTTWAGVTPGTGVATALAINVGSAGAPVLFDGALGTPSSGTGTNLTGIPETAITDGTLLARLAANETVTGAYTFTAKPDLQVNNGAVTPALRVSNLAAGGQGPSIEYFTGFGSKVIGYETFQASGAAGASYSLYMLRQADGVLTETISASNTGAVSMPVSLSIGGGSAISSSSNVALLDAANAFTAAGTQSITNSADALLGIKIKNVNAGAAAGMYVSLTDDFWGGTYLSWQGHGYTTSGFYYQDGSLLLASGAGGLSLVASDASGGDMRLYSRNTLALTLGASQAATFTGSIISSVSVALTGTTNNVGTITTGVWNAGAVTSSGAFTSSTSAALTGLTNNLGTITTGIWNAGAVTSSGGGSFTTGAFSSTVTLSGTAANIALGSNYLSGDGGDEGISVDASGNGTISGTWKLTGNLLLGTSIMDSVGTPACTSGCTAIVGKDYAFKITSSAGPSAVDHVVTFGNTWTTAPICVATAGYNLGDTYNWAITSVTTTVLTLTYSGGPQPGSQAVYVLCRSY